MAHLQEGRTYHEVATALRVPKITVQGWVQRFKAAGNSAKRKLAAAQEAEFKKAVTRLQDQRLGGRITGQDIRALLEEQFQVACCLNKVYNLLARLNLVWITVRSKHPKQSQASQDTFKKNFRVSDESGA